MGLELVVFEENIFKVLSHSSFDDHGFFIAKNNERILIHSYTKDSTGKVCKYSQVCVGEKELVELSKALNDICYERLRDAC